MKKKNVIEIASVVFIGFIAVFMFGSLLYSIATGKLVFTEQEMYYKGQLRPVSQIEEIIADELEVENPDLDLEISILEEDEDED